MHKLFLLLILSWASIAQSQSADTDYILLKAGVDGQNKSNETQVAFYIDLPDSNNFVGTNFRIIAQRIRSDTTQINWLTGALLDSLAIGAKLEVIRTVRFDPNLTKGQKQTVIDNTYTNNIDAFLATWYAQHDTYGLAREIP